MSKTVTEWVLKLVDDITSPMRSVQDSCEDAREAAEGAAGGIDEIHEAAGKMPETAAKMGAAAFVFNQVADAVGKINSEIKNVTSGQLEFETSMAKANTMAELQGEEFSKATNDIREMSKEIPILRKELAAGFYQVVSNSVPKDNWMTFLKDTSKASIGGVADLGQAVKVTSTIIKNYNLAWDEAGLIQDKIQKTAKLGVTSFSELGEALPRVAGNAKTLGVNIDELLGSYATLTGVSGNTAEVSTQLAAIFTALVKPSTEAAQTASAIGIQFDAAAIQASGGMQKYFDLLQSRVEAYASATGELSTEIYGRLFGSAEALRAFLPLTGEIGDVWKEKSVEVANAAGTIEQAYEMMSSTAEAETTILQNQISDFRDRIVEAISGCLPFVTVMGDAFTSVANFGFAVYGLSIILKKDLWVGLLSGIKGISGFVLQCVSGTVASVKFAAASVLSFGSFKLAAVSACRAVGVAIMNIPIIGWIAAIIAGLIALGTYFYNTSESFRGFLWGLWESIKAVFGGIGKFLGDVFGGIWHLIDGVFNPVNWFKKDYRFSDGIDRIKNAALELGETVGSAFSDGRDKGIKDFINEKREERELEEGSFNFTPAPGDDDIMQIPGKREPIGTVPVTGGETKVLNLGGGGSGSGGGSKSVTMNVTFNQTFNVPGGSAQGVADEVMRVITGVLRDATIATT